MVTDTDGCAQGHRDSARIPDSPESGCCTAVPVFKIALLACLSTWQRIRCTFGRWPICCTATRTKAVLSFLIGLCRTIQATAPGEPGR